MRQKTVSLSVVVWVLVALASSPVSHAGNIHVMIGQKMLDDGDWEPVEDQSEYGIHSNWGRPGWPLQLAFDLYLSSDDTTLDVFGAPVEVDAKTTEFGIGLRKIWGKRGTRPYLGGGLALMEGEFEAFAVKDSDKAAGFWIDGGVFWRLSRHFNLGFNLRVSRGEITLFDLDAEAGGEHAGLILGYGW